MSDDTRPYKGGFEAMYERMHGDDRPKTPAGWSDTDWIKHLQERGEYPHPLAAVHINQGSMDAAADAYEAEYNAAHKTSDLLCTKQKFLTAEDFAMLFAFHNQMDDPDADGYSARKNDIRRMAELGVIQSRGFGHYAVTMFGYWLIETEFDQNPPLPLKTAAEYNARKA